ncbi:MAG: response regulator transcription factor [Verrucomicrobiales bacterium]|nr:response regulator transcription factor [Verrucomicrobiales bacterium]
MKRILIIEDHADMRRNLRLMLRLEGFAIFEADNGVAGVAAARQHRPDLILCDVMMPKLDGYGVLKELREDPDTRTIPFLFLTAKGDKLDIRHGMNLGADDYLPKPVGRDELMAAIEARLERARQQSHPEFKPNFASAIPLETIGLTPREAEVLLWIAQGKSNGDIGALLGMVEVTVKKHVTRIFEKLGVETRNAATLRALEVLSSEAAK